MCTASVASIHTRDFRETGARGRTSVKTRQETARANSANRAAETLSEEKLETQELPERELVRLAIDGDSNAQDALFAKYRTRLYRLALRLLRKREEAEDAVQDALLSAYRNLATFEGRSLFSTWLTRIVVNAALVRMRRHRARPELFLQDVFPEERASMASTFVDSRPDPEQTYSYSETQQLVKGALEELSPSIRSAFQLRELQDLSNSEAARASGVQLGAFKSRISRARSQLAQRLSPNSLAPLHQAFSAPIPASRRVNKAEAEPSLAG